MSPLRSRIAMLMDAEEKNITIVTSVTEILSQLPSFLAPHSGSKIIFVSTDFPASTRP